MGRRSSHRIPTWGTSTFSWAPDRMGRRPSCSSARTRRTSHASYGAGASTPFRPREGRHQRSRDEGHPDRQSRPARHQGGRVVSPRHPAWCQRGDPSATARQSSVRRQPCGRAWICSARTSSRTSGPSASGRRTSSTPIYVGQTPLMRNTGSCAALAGMLWSKPVSTRST